MDWIRKSFEAAGLTQHPTGRHLDAVQNRFGGAVFLCLDVSGSMHGERIRQAVLGCRTFIREALAARYRVGLVLWHHDIEASTELTADAVPLMKLLDGAVASGGNAVVPTLSFCDKRLRDRRGDRVVAIFGDGDLGPAQAAASKAAELREHNIRIITCGLGEASARELDTISSETARTPRRADADNISGAIAAMASTLRRQP